MPSREFHTKLGDPPDSDDDHDDGDDDSRPTLLKERAATSWCAAPTDRSGRLTRSIRMGRGNPGAIAASGPRSQAGDLDVVEPKDFLVTPQGRGGGREHQSSAREGLSRQEPPAGQVILVAERRFVF